MVDIKPVASASVTRMTPCLAGCCVCIWPVSSPWELWLRDETRSRCLRMIEMEIRRKPSWYVSEWSGRHIDLGFSLIIGIDYKEKHLKILTFELYLLCSCGENSLLTKSNHLGKSLGLKNRETCILVALPLLVCVIPTKGSICGLGVCVCVCV